MKRLLAAAAVGLALAAALLVVNVLMRAALCFHSELHSPITLPHGQPLVRGE